jgi:hypothetical protein
MKEETDGDVKSGERRWTDNQRTDTAVSHDVLRTKVVIFDQSRSNLFFRQRALLSVGSELPDSMNPAKTVRSKQER